MYNYSAGRRVSELKRLKYGRLMNNHKEKIKVKDKTIKKYEQELACYNSKTINYKNFNEYMYLKIKMRMETKESRYNGYIIKQKWYGYINKQRYEEKFLNELEKVYSKKSIMVIGDYGDKGNIRRINVPHSGIKKILKKRFEVYLIDEYNTSKLNYRTEKKGEKLKMRMKYEINGEEKTYIKEMHSILTFKMGKEGSGCINRDFNACMNMLKIIKSLIKFGKKPYNYNRKNFNKVVNPLNVEGKDNQPEKGAYRGRLINVGQQ